jgi:hypothetical protein
MLILQYGGKPRALYTAVSAPAHRAPRLLSELPGEKVSSISSGYRTDPQFEGGDILGGESWCPRLLRI